jgi:hypothetical protein
MKLQERDGGRRIDGAASDSHNADLISSPSIRRPHFRFTAVVPRSDLNFRVCRNKARKHQVSARWPVVLVMRGLEELPLDRTQPGAFVLAGGQRIVAELKRAVRNDISASHFRILQMNKFPASCKPSNHHDSQHQSKRSAHLCCQLEPASRCPRRSDT